MWNYRFDCNVVGRDPPEDPDRPDHVPGATTDAADQTQEIAAKRMFFEIKYNYFFFQ